ncbi:ShlB/FhaC/HecB family hemolysin secretion/activation protein [Massilia sp. CCM 8692]|uniref:ShlB/FhaC/HecB family hemolysin secretion/activation protein n=1 Tax=Massilia rubra TaxID=2607910 RepID=A0ABX0LSE7_9BURK|nr:ShlB/FhaC/HecB family hemolysin secretion/activation protein [Massilia rubra]
MRSLNAIARVHSSAPHRHREGSLSLKTLQPSTLSLALGLILGGAAVHAQAQQPPTIGDAVRQAQPLPPPLARPAPPLPVPGGPAPAALQALPGGGAAVAVRQFALEGNRVIDSATLLALLAPEQGQTLTLAQLDELATRITRHYRAKGYFVARAYIPAQELSGGTLTIRVVEGHYGRFILDNRSRVNDGVVQGLLDDIKGRDIVSLDTLERAMLIINDTPGARVVQADVMPGEQVGTSDFAIATEATPAVAGYVLLDNHGSVYTGKQRLSFSADWQSPSGRGERLSASGMATRHGGLLNGRLGYSMLAASDGTRAELAVSRTTYELGDVYRALDATGTASGAELGLSKPLKRTRKDSIDAGLSLAYKDLKDEIGSVGTTVGKRLASLTASVTRRSEGALLGWYGQGQYSAGLTIGKLDFKDALAEALDAAGDATQGSYARLNLTATRTSVLPASFTLSTAIKAQAALGNKKLDGVERMSVAGSGAVAAYPTGELSGDHAALLRAELARALPAQVSASVFADYGWAKSVNAAAGVDATRSLGDVGLGLSALRGGLLLKLQVVHRVSGGPALSEPVSRTRLLFQAGWVM